MHMAVIEFARHVLGFEGAHTSEIAPNTKYPVIDLMPEQLSVTKKGGTMRLGKYPCRLLEGTIARNCYGQDEISERHRHRYEYNNDYRARFEESGMRIAGLSPNGRLVEIVEIPGHPWYVGVQFHPEFKSRPNRAHPLFRDFIRAAVERKYNADK
jgi:CTP synthase